MADSLFQAAIANPVQKVWDAMFPDKTVAYSRITRTPIVLDRGNLDRRGIAGTREPDSNGGHLLINPPYLQPNLSIIPHESAHQIVAKAWPDLAPGLAGLATQVPEAQRNLILAHPLYQQMKGAGQPEQMMDEGLGFSIGDPDATKYVQEVASRIKDPTLRDQLLRLHYTALQANKSRGNLY